MTTIYLVRHAQASLGQANYDQLSALGQLQAKVLGQYLTTLFEQRPYIVTGTMQRHLRTAELALQTHASDYQLQSSTDWNEFDHRDILKQYTVSLGLTEQLQQALEQRKTTPKPLMTLLNTAMQHWMSGQDDSLYTESWNGFSQRIEKALGELFTVIRQQQCHHVVVFSSGGVISTVLGKILALSPAKTLQLNTALTNVSISTIHLPVSAASWREAHVLSINEHYYLRAMKYWIGQTEQDQIISEQALLTWV